MTEYNGTILDYLRNISNPKIGAIQFRQRWILKNESLPKRYDGDQQVLVMSVHHVQKFFDDYFLHRLDPNEGVVRHYRDVISGNWGKVWLQSVERMGNFSMTDYPELYSGPLLKNVQDRSGLVTKTTTKLMPPREYQKRTHRRCGKMHDDSLCLQRSSKTEPEKAQTSRKATVQNTFCANQTPAAPEKRTHTSKTTSQLPSSLTTMGASSSVVHQNDHQKEFMSNNVGEQIVLMTAEGLVWNYSSNSYERALFFFDTGAQVSLILEGAAEHLALPVAKTEQCSLSGISGISETFLSHHVVLRIQTAQGRELEFTVKTKPTITTGFPSVHLVERDTLFMEEYGIYLSNTRMRGEHQYPHVLIGLDLYSSFVYEHHPPVQLPTGLRIARTLFGFAAYGRGLLDSQKSCNFSVCCNTINTESEMIKNIFELESLGIMTKEGSDDETAYAYLSQYAKSITYEDHCVIAPFPLKGNIVDLSDNYNMAIRRLIALMKHLEKFPKQKEWYAKILNQYLRDNVIEEVTEPVPAFYNYFDYRQFSPTVYASASYSLFICLPIFVSAPERVRFHFGHPAGQATTDQYRHRCGAEEARRCCTFLCIDIVAVLRRRGLYYASQKSKT
ncbi:hypothetical protein TELCIR_05766, partial [Teladorsagia circumcincta]